MGARCCKEAECAEFAPYVPHVEPVEKPVEVPVAVQVQDHELPLSPDDIYAKQPPSEFCWQIVSLGNSHGVAEDQRKGWCIASRAADPVSNVGNAHPRGSYYYLRIPKAVWQGFQRP